jgi:hypothetical protein
VATIVAMAMIRCRRVHETHMTSTWSTRYGGFVPGQAHRSSGDSTGQVELPVVQGDDGGDGGGGSGGCSG